MQVNRLRLSKNLQIFYNWGLGRSPKRGEGGSPTFSPFPGERGLGIGIENKHFFEKTDYFYKLMRFNRLRLSFINWR